MSWPPVLDRPSIAPSFTDQIIGLPSQPSSVAPSKSLIIVPPAGFSPASGGGVLGAVSLAASGVSLAGVPPLPPVSPLPPLPPLELEGPEPPLAARPPLPPVSCVAGVPPPP